MSDMPAGSPERTVAMLEGTDGNRARRFPLRGATVTIGQGPRNEVILEDETVSTSHARLEHGGGEWRLTDLGSRNGTWVDGTRVEAGVPIPLADGITVAFGAARLTFHANVAIEGESTDSPARPATSAPERAAGSPGLRLPVWLALLVILVIAALVFLVLTLTDESTVTEPLTGATAGILSNQVSASVSGPILTEPDMLSTAEPNGHAADRTTV